MKTTSTLRRCFRFLAGLAILLFLSALPAKATINVIGYWRMGESDPGAVAGGVAINSISINSAGATNLIFTIARYSTNVSTIAATNIRSSLSISLTNSAYARTNIVSGLTDGFGIEAWVQPTKVNSTTQVIAYNGSTATDGWGLIIGSDNNYAALIGGITILTGSPAQNGVWAHLAVIRNSPNTIFYVNGVAVATNGGFPNPPAGNFAVGATSETPASQFFTGLVDEVRVFSFIGPFSTKDLLINAVPPSATADMANPLTATSSTLNGDAFPNGNPTAARFLWGTNTSYGQVTAPIIVTTNSTPVSIAITGLSLGGTYHYALSVSNLNGTNISLDSMFTVGGFAPTTIELPGLTYSDAVLGDYDNDGRPDILLCGYSSKTISSFTQVWHNNGDGTFSNINAGLPGVSSGSLAWGDYDGDGQLDILFEGQTSSPVGNIAQVWHNNGNGTFSNINAGLPGIAEGSVAWGDYDNDGLPDILLLGSPGGGNGLTQIWHNNGGGTFSQNTNAGLPGIFRGAAAWGDYDNDGRLDILLSGVGPSGPTTQVWHNNGDGTFSNINAGLPGAYDSSVAWGDYDNDGRLDILISGDSSPLSITQVWHNNGNGTFSQNTNAVLPGAEQGSVAWGDYDNDGRLDILLSGSGTTPGPGGVGLMGISITQVWRNNGDGTFSNINASLPPLAFGSATWGDYDGDGRLDVLISGNGEGTSAPPAIQLWRNETLQTNTPPQAPSGLFEEISGTDIIFRWNPPTDSQTPSAGLSYNLRVGSSPGAADVVFLMSATNGLLTVPRPGNSQSLGRLTPKNLAGNRLYWSVQAVDASFAGSSFAPEKSFAVMPVLAPLNATNSFPGDLDGDGVVDETELAKILAHLSTNGTVSPGNLDLALRNYLAVYSFAMSNVDGLGGSNILFTLPNFPNANLSVQSSTNLVDWDTLGPVNYGFIDTNAATNLHRFYRLSYP